MKKYVIAYNQQDEEGKEVSALDIYKFVVKDSEVEGEGTELVPINSATGALQQANDSKRLKDLKRTIYEELVLIWKLTKIEEKKKAIQRMYIKYHPKLIQLIRISLKRYLSLCSGKLIDRMQDYY